MEAPASPPVRIVPMTHVTAFHLGSNHADICKYYREHQVVHIRGCKPFCHSVRADTFGMSSIRRLFAAAPAMVNQTFSGEAESPTDHGHCSLSAAAVLGAEICPDGCWYVSFIAQGGAEGRGREKAAEELRQSLPFHEPPLQPVGTEMDQTDPVWIFIGRNTSRDEKLVGRPEHTDDVSHDGTWHYQCEGSKTWYLRPANTAEWGNTAIHIEPGNEAADKSAQFGDGINRLKVVVEEGDIIMLNTRVWWHQTRIPFTSKRRLSLSYARDFYCDSMKHVQPDTTSSARVSKAKQKSDEQYSNVVGLYATRELAAGEVVLTENELPDCSLPRSDEPNCEVTELEDGTGALVALEDIHYGEYFTIAPSDSEDGSSDEDDEEESPLSGGYCVFIK